VRLGRDTSNAKKVFESWMKLEGEPTKVITSFQTVFFLYIFVCTSTYYFFFCPYIDFMWTLYDVV